MRPEQPNFSPWEPVPPEPLPQPPAPARTQSPHAGAGDALLRGVGVAALTILMLVILSTLGALSVYAYFARDLPSPQELRARATPFKSTKIYDRNGKLLFEVFDPRGGRRTVVPIEEIPAVVIHATVATEDATFFVNPGVNPFSIARSLYYNLRNGEVVFGGSTITQQLVKNVYLTGEKTLSRKVKEAILAAEITRRYSKEEILEIYLNEVFYGNLAYGIGAAAETYFGKQPADLTLAEAALLTGLIQSPALYDPYTNPEAALARRATVLRLMHERGYIRQSELEAALRQPLGVVPRTVKMEAPHMVMYVREQLEKLYGTEMLYKGGLEVYTTLDLNMQRIAEEVARARIAALRDQNASNAALVAMDPQTGDVLAMLGSVDFNDRAIGGQVNVARMPRQPGSTIKPLTYLAAMERGMTAGTLVMDVAQDFPDGANPPYRPKNYDDKEYGPISVRTALACSRNIPAVATLQQIGLPALLEMARRLGIQSLNRPDYGLSLTLGGGEVTLLELTAAYAALANGGRRVTPRTILYIEDQEGRVIMPRTKPEMPQVLDPRRAYIITHILADDKARQPSFGTNNPMKLSFPAAAKTGTTDDYRDSWTEGYTPQLVTGVWVGNNDNKPMKQLSGARGAALIWHDFMERALAGQPHPDFARPAKIVELEVCPVSGHPRGETCPPPVKELFLSEEAPKDACPVHKKLAVCKISGKLATQYCPAGGVETRAFEDYGPQWDAWARQRNIATPPREACPLHTAPSKVAIEIPSGPLSGIVEVRGTTDIADFFHYVVEYGIGPNPIGWGRITPEISAPVFDGVLCRWDTSRLANGTYSLRVVVTDRHGGQYEAKAVTELRHITPTAPPTYTPLPSATPSLAPSATPTARPASPTPEPTDTPPPTATPPLHLASPTPEPTDTPPSTATLPRPSATASAAPDVTPTATASPRPSPTVTAWLPTRPPVPRPTFIIGPGYPEPVVPTRTRSPRRM